MSDRAEYVGPLEALKGKIASVEPDDTYELPLRERTLSAKFEEEGLKHPETGAAIGKSWHTFPVTDFWLLAAW